MNRRAKHHTVDMLFVITLFAVFALSVVALTGMGAGVYQNVADEMEDSYNSRTAFSYITNKVHQSDVNGEVTVGTFEGQDALILLEEIDNVTYATYLYYYDGYLKELFTRYGQDFDPEYGTDILKLSSFNVEMESDSLIHFEYAPTEEKRESVYVHVRSN